jgi:DNA polymerase-1
MTFPVLRKRFKYLFLLASGFLWAFIYGLLALVVFFVGLGYLLFECVRLISTGDLGPEKHGWRLSIDEPFGAWSYLQFWSKPVVIDVEDNEKGTFVGLGLVASEGEVFYFTQITPELKKVLEKLELVAHAGRTDLHKLKKWGVNVRPEQLVFDTMQAAHTIDSTRRAYGLKDLAAEICGIHYPDYKDLTGRGRNKTTLDALPTELVANYNAMDCIATYRLWMRFKDSLEGCLEYFEQLEMPVSHVLFRMEEKGIKISLSRLEELKKRIGARREFIKARIDRCFGKETSINLNSPKQLLAALHSLSIFPTLKRKPSTDKRALEPFRGKLVIDLLVKYSQLETLLCSFINPYLERGDVYVHPEFLQARTRTGRLACKNPNLQQIPARTLEGGAIRSAFIPESGHRFWDGDFGQIEPRIMAHLSEDRTLSDMFRQGINFHKFTAERMGMPKDRAKVLNLSVGYRATSKSVSAQLKCSEAEAQKEIDRWWAMFPRLRQWEDETIAKARRDGYVTTLFGRRIKLENINSYTSWQREAAERDAINNLVQGSAAEVMKKALLALDKEGADIRVSIHDEALIEVFGTAEELDRNTSRYAEVMGNCANLRVPLSVEWRVGSNWQECK